MFSRIFGKQMRTEKPNAIGRWVRYKFNLPGYSNFHLLPYRLHKQPLYVYAPQRKQLNYMGHASKQLNQLR